MAPTPAIEELRRDREMLRVEVAGLEAMLQAMRQGPQAREEALNGPLLSRLTDFRASMESHFRREEEELFPDAKRVLSDGAPGGDVVGQFLAEEADDDLSTHAKVRERVAEMLALLGEARAKGELGEEQGRQLWALFGLFRSVLELHAAKEDDLIFPMVERALTPGQRDAVVEQLTKDSGPPQAEGPTGLASDDEQCAC